MITIVDYGSGNLRSVEKAFNRILVPVKISSKPEAILQASKLILPGVGHFKKGMDNLAKSGLTEALNQAVLELKTPILGICLGMQLMTSYSEEGDTKGLDWIPAKTKKFKESISSDFKVPHMGWNGIERNGIPELIDNKKFSSDLFYFVHSYYVESESDELDVFITNYGREIISGFRMKNIYGVQFHPEKSHRQGLQLLKSFSSL